MIAMCGGLVLDDTTFDIVDKVIVAKDTEAVTGTVAANCGGIKFCTDDFKLVGKTITSVKVDDEDVIPMEVEQKGCGCVLVDSSCFELDGDKLVFNKPADPEPPEPNNPDENSDEQEQGESEQSGEESTE